jgi:hypothetical protein
MTNPTPAIKKLLVFTHGGMVIRQFAAHQHKAIAKLVVKLLVVVPNHV